MTVLGLRHGRVCSCDGTTQLGSGSFAVQDHLDGSEFSVSISGGHIKFVVKFVAGVCVCVATLVLVCHPLGMLTLPPPKPMAASPTRAAVTRPALPTAMASGRVAALPTITWSMVHASQSTLATTTTLGAATLASMTGPIRAIAHALQIAI